MTNVQEAPPAIDPAQVRIQLLNTYILRAVNLCVDRGILRRELRTTFNITQKGHIQAATLDVSEDELRAAFEKLGNVDYVNASLEYEDVFNGVVSKGEVVH